MTLPEFKAWFEGFAEALDSAPTEKQWDQVKARVTQVSGQTVVAGGHSGGGILGQNARNTDTAGPVGVGRAGAFQ